MLYTRNEQHCKLTVLQLKTNKKHHTSFYLSTSVWPPCYGDHTQQVLSKWLEKVTKAMCLL